MADRLMLVFTNPIQGQDEAFNDWYDTRHVVDVLNVPGVVAVQRYDLAPMTLPDGDAAPAELPPPAHRYLAVYELADDPDSVMNEFLSRAADGRLPLSETLDLTSISMTTWSARGERTTVT
ncbi:hypothetical protein MYCO108962_00520 [Mycobacterium colombiense]|uniref:EthD domain-containing protein n=1 Tax=Mycobacterium colombiense CECT 3035 TaxID=1041522 RepID=J4JVP8_9MYCO|nr:hypothetical protein [Mycobacterium colombiense]EJO89412.1 hypothetical protein MCOL_V204465 [Mycobacterium colombiense CECT 3035]